MPVNDFRFKNETENKYSMRFKKVRGIEVVNSVVDKTIQNTKIPDIVKDKIKENKPKEIVPRNMLSASYLKKTEKVCLPENLNNGLINKKKKLMF